MQYWKKIKQKSCRHQRNTSRSMEDKKIWRHTLCTQRCVWTKYNKERNERLHPLLPQEKRNRNQKELLLLLWLWRFIILCFSIISNLKLRWFKEKSKQFSRSRSTASKYWLSIESSKKLLQISQGNTIVDFSKAFDSIHREKMETILLTYGISRETLNAFIMLEKKNTKAMVRFCHWSLPRKYICTICIYNLPTLRTMNFNISYKRKWFHKRKVAENIPQKQWQTHTLKMI